MTIATTTTQADKLLERAAQLFPGGVNSPVRAFKAVGKPPLLLERGKGPYVWDTDGTRYVDLIGSWGAALIGHANPHVVEAVQRAANNGFALGATHPLEIELAERIRDAMPALEKLRFTSSGTEAVMSAIRLARAATGRDLIVKFAGAYHGHSDSMLVEAGSGVATLGIPGSAGIPGAVAAATIVVEFNDQAALERAFATHPSQIAGVIVEPVIANSGVIPPADGYLDFVRDLAGRNGALLIFDEVITGFRVGHGGAQARYGIAPDLTTLGKVIGGGMPIGAYGGRADIMNWVAPAGPVYQAGTLSGHPLAMAAGTATLDTLATADYDALFARVDRLADRLRQAAVEANAAMSVVHVGALLTLFFAPVAPVGGSSAAASVDRAAFGRFFGAMLERGVLLPPSQFEAWFPGFAHSEADFATIADAAQRALRA